MLNEFFLLVVLVLTDNFVWGEWDNHSKEFFEGDIIPEFYSLARAYGEDFAGSLVSQGIIDGPKKNLLRATVPNPDALWNQLIFDDHKIIDVFIETSDYSVSQVDLIRNSLKELSKKTAAVKFRFHSIMPNDGRPFLNIGHHSNNICASYVGRTTMANRATGQEVYLANGCLTTRTIQHEMLHALGFWHEQNRPDRDAYIDIREDNIMPGLETNFVKRQDVNSLGSPYDYQSVMHYGEFFFSKNGERTIDSRGNVLGNDIGASTSDILQVRLLYQCNSGPRTLAEYRNDKCSADCKCGKRLRGCDNNDDCKGALICSRGGQCR